MTLDPRDAIGAIKEYGPNIPSAIYLMYAPDGLDFEGKLPVNIYTLNSSNKFTSTVLYARGTGLVMIDKQDD